MDTVGIRELTAHLSRHLRRVRSGARVLVTRAFEDDWPRYLAVDVSAAICREAGHLAERHRLRGHDSVHLASYLEIARRSGAAETRFSSFDDRLNRAARAAVTAMVRTVRR